MRGANGQRRQVKDLCRRGWSTGRALAAVSLSGLALVIVAGPGVAATSGVSTASRSMSGIDGRSTQSLQNGGTAPAIAEIVSGAATDGDVWTLFVNGPNDNLCLSVQLKGSNVSPGRCNTESIPVARQHHDRVYRPLVFEESRTSAFLYGRLPEGTEQVAMVRTNGGVLAEQKSIAGPTGPFYVVELLDGTRPTTVVGTRSDGTVERFAVEWPSRSNSGGRTRVRVVLATAIAFAILVRSIHARRRAQLERERRATY